MFISVLQWSFMAVVILLSIPQIFFQRKFRPKRHGSVSATGDSSASSVTVHFQYFGSN